MEKMMQRARPLTRLASRGAFRRGAISRGAPLTCHPAPWRGTITKSYSSQEDNAKDTWTALAARPPSRVSPPLAADGDVRVVSSKRDKGWLTSSHPPFVEVNDGWLRIVSQEAARWRPFAVPLAWLRDICPCPQCVNPDSGQKRFSTADIPDKLTVAQARVLPEEGGRLQVEWKADSLSGGENHVSRYTVEDLVGNRPELYVPIRRPWNKADLEDRLTRIPYADWATDGQPFWRALGDLYRTGLIIITHMPQELTAVLDAARRIGPIQDTFYGASWDVYSMPRAVNVAYTSEFLGLHQDLLYMIDPPGVQLLHCLRNEAKGGESIFSDGLRAAWEVHLNPQTASLMPALRDIPVPYAYRRNGHEYRQSRPVVDWRGGVIGDIAWAPPFQDSFRLPANDSRSPSTSNPAAERFLLWKKAAKAFSDAASAERGVLEFKLRPGQCVVFDNRRILHGRREFDTTAGHRHLKGTYVARQDLLSRLQRLRHQDLTGENIDLIPLYHRRSGAVETAFVDRLLQSDPATRTLGPWGKKIW